LGRTSGGKWQAEGRRRAEKGEREKQKEEAKVGG